MKPTEDNDLARFIDDELKRLPATMAPAGLTKRVLATLEARQNAPWWKKSLWSWPPVARLAGLAVFISLGTTMAFALAWVDVPSLFHFEAGQTVMLVISRQCMRLLDFLDLIGSWLFSPAVKPWLMNLLLLGAAAYLVLIGVGSAFVRLALHPRRGV